MPAKTTIERGDHRADVTTPVYFSLAQAAKTLPPGRNGRPAHVATLVRWITTGSRGPNGETVRLRAIRMGGRWLTTADWLEEFGQSLTPTFGAKAVPPASATRRRADERAEKELEAIGI